MPIKIDRKPNPQMHVEHVTLTDHFGNRHLMTIHPFEVRGNSKDGFTFVTIDVTAQIEQQKQFMEERERRFFEHMMKNHPEHPLVLSHPANRDPSPTSSGQANSGSSGNRVNEDRVIGWSGDREVGENRVPSPSSSGQAKNGSSENRVTERRGGDEWCKQCP